jgi:hypothetical protein
MDWFKGKSEPETMVFTIKYSALMGFYGGSMGFYGG